MDREIEQRRGNEDGIGGHSEEISFRYIPQELVLNVLRRLPTKSLVRFRCVSKQWSTWISDIQSFRLKVLVCKYTELDPHDLEYDESKTRISSFCIDRNINFKTVYECIDDGKTTTKGFSNCIRQEDNLYSIRYYSSSPSTPDIPDISDVLMGDFMGSCDGLVLMKLHNDLFLWNPSIGYYKKVLSHNKLCHREYRVVSVGLFFDSNNGEYKALMALLYKYHPPESGVLMVGSFKSKTWTHVDSPYIAGSIKAGPVYDNHLHCLAYNYCEENSGWHIVYFNPKMDEFVDVPTPELSEPEEYTVISLSVLDGCLCIAHNRDKSNTDKGSFEILVMKEYCVKESWEILFTIELGGVDCFSKVEPLLYTEDKEKVLVKVETNDRSGISAFDRNGKLCLDVVTFDKRRDDAIVYEETFVRPEEDDDNNWDERQRRGEAVYAERIWPWHLYLNRP